MEMKNFRETSLNTIRYRNSGREQLYTSINFELKFMQIIETSERLNKKPQTDWAVLALDALSILTFFHVILPNVFSALGES